MSAPLRSVITLSIGLVIFVGLPMVGWGLQDTRGFFNHPARLGYVVLAVLLQLTVVIRLPEAGRNRGAGQTTVRRQRLALLLLQGIPLAIVIVAPFTDQRGIGAFGELEIVRYLGLTLFALGFAGMHWAEAVLDKQFSVQVTIQEGHRLVTKGPYRYLRHPRYLGIILFTTGISLVFRSWATLILVAALVAVLVWRIYDEEMLMHQAFGLDWESYSERTWRLVPHVY
jgi:protein-S-isoprenylcysteine O-methyltransferase Ste14